MFLYLQNKITFFPTINAKAINALNVLNSKILNTEVKKLYQCFGYSKENIYKGHIKHINHFKIIRNIFQKIRKVKKFYFFFYFLFYFSNVYLRRKFSALNASLLSCFFNIIEPVPAITMQCKTMFVSCL